jgi:hypothetical protein
MDIGANLAGMMQNYEHQLASPRISNVLRDQGSTRKHLQVIPRSHSQRPRESISAIPDGSTPRIICCAVTPGLYGASVYLHAAAAPCDSRGGLS